VHDITDLERRGIPGVFVASGVFVDAAEKQSVALGFHPARLFVEHPIQDRTDEEMAIIADKAVDALVEKLTAAAL
jgi:hypothetical protein